MIYDKSFSSKDFQIQLNHSYLQSIFQAWNFIINKIKNLIITLTSLT